MPARSNDFQAVVYFVHQHIAADATVEESRSLTDRITGELREVDVLINARVAGQPILIGVEVRDHKRTNVVGWVEEMRAKHDDLPTDRLVLVSASGFSKAAALKARHYNIETVTPGQPIASDGPLAKLQQTVIEMRDVTFKNLAEIRGTFMVDGRLHTLPLTPDHVLFTAEGAERGHVASLVQIACAHFTEERAAVASATEGDQYLVVEVTGTRFRLDDADPVEVYLRSETPSRRLHRLLVLQITWAARVDIRPVDLSSGDLQGTAYAYGRGQVGGVDALVVLTANEQGEQLKMRFTDASGEVTDWVADRERQELLPDRPLDDNPATP